MSNDEPTGSDQEPASSPGRRLSADEVAAKHARAQARRAGFRAVLARLGLRAAEVARRAGLPNANAIYNFLNGRSDSLAQVTLERIASALGVDAEELMGRSRQPGRSGASPDAPLPPDAVWLTCDAGAAMWHSTPRRPEHLWERVAIPPGFLRIPPAAFAVRLTGVGSEGLYPRGTIVICVPVAGLQLVNPGPWRALVRRERMGSHELTLQELSIRGTRCWLTPRSEHPALQAVTVLSWPPEDRTGDASARTGGSTVIDGIVISRWQPEPGLAQP